MKMISHLAICILCSLLCATAVGQPSSNDIKAARQMVDEEQKVFRDFLTTASLNGNIKKGLQKFAINDVNSLQNNLQYLVTAPREKRVKGIRSLSYFMKEMEQQLKEDKIDQLELPEIVKKYKQTLNDLLSRRSNETVDRNFKYLDWRSCQLLANAFWEFGEKQQMADISAYKGEWKPRDNFFLSFKTKPTSNTTTSWKIFRVETNPNNIYPTYKKIN